MQVSGIFVDAPFC